jgi:hypothetical protein
MLRVATQRMMAELIGRAIALHQTFRLSDKLLGPMVAMANGVTNDDQALRLTGIEMKTSGVVITADEAILDWTTEQIEPRGHVRIRPVTSEDSRPPYFSSPR